MFVALKTIRTKIDGQPKVFNPGDILTEKELPNPRACLKTGYVVYQDDAAFVPRSIDRLRYRRRRGALKLRYPEAFDMSPKPAAVPEPVAVVAPEPVVMVEEDTPVIAEPVVIEEEPEAEPEVIEEEPEVEAEPEPEEPAKFVLLRSDVDGMKRPELVKQANELGADFGKNARKGEALEFLEAYIED